LGDAHFTERPLAVQVKPRSGRFAIVISVGHDSLQHKGERKMLEVGHRLFVGIKISTKLQNDLDRPAPGTEHYFNTDSADYLHVVTVGEQKLIGRYVKDGFPASDMDNVSRNVCSIVKLITRGHRIEEGSVHIYAA
jgi:hypothetical protein